MAAALETVTKYEVMFTARTGVTILTPLLKTFDGGVDIHAHFIISPDNPRDLILSADGKQALLKDMKKDFLDEAIERKFIMFYEMKGEEVVRCTPCSYGKA